MSPHSHVSTLTSMTRKTKFGVSWKRRDTESVTEAVYPEAAVSATTRKKTATPLLTNFDHVMKILLVAYDKVQFIHCTVCCKAIAPPDNINCCIEIKQSGQRGMMELVLAFH